MIEIDIDKLDDSIVIHLAGRATIETARELKLNILSCTPETRHLIIDAGSLLSGDISFFQIIISTFRDMKKQGKCFSFLPSDRVRRDASLLFGDFSLVCELLGIDPPEMRDILLGEKLLIQAVHQPA